MPTVVRDAQISQVISIVQPSSDGLGGRTFSYEQFPTELDLSLLR